MKLNLRLFSFCSHKRALTRTHEKTIYIYVDSDPYTKNIDFAPTRLIFTKKFIHIRKISWYKEAKIGGFFFFLCVLLQKFEFL